MQLLTLLHDEVFMAKVSFETTQEQDELLKVYAVKNLPDVQIDDISIILKNIVKGITNSMESERLKSRMGRMKLSEIKKALDDYEFKTGE